MQLNGLLNQVRTFTGNVTALLLVSFASSGFAQGQSTEIERPGVPAVPKIERNYTGWAASPTISKLATPIAGNSSDAKAEQLPAVMYASYFQTQSSGSFPPPPLYPPAPVYPQPQTGQQSQVSPQSQVGQQSQVYPQSQGYPAAPAGSPSAVPAGLRRRNEPNAGPPLNSLPQYQTVATGNGVPSGNVVGGQQNPQQIATGLPFVTPPPASSQSLSRYPTSPYMGPRSVAAFQTAGYQRVVPNQSVTSSVTGLPPGQSTAYQNPVFSRNPQPGIYPTSYQQCQVLPPPSLPPPSLPPDGMQGQTYIPPTFTPNWNPNLYASNNVGLKPLFTLGQENYNVVLGRGLIGQPKAYVPGQGVRNFLRYLTP
jgi:hypothetical protein